MLAAETVTGEGEEADTAWERGALREVARRPSRAVTARRIGLDRSRESLKNGSVFEFQPMATSITQAEVLIALVVAAHAGVLAVRLCFSLFKA